MKQPPTTTNGQQNGMSDAESASLHNPDSDSV